MKRNNNIDKKIAKTICDNYLAYKERTIPKEVSSSLEGINPKDLIGATKPDLSLIPTSALIHVAMCMQNGAKKYGAYNWREEGKKVGQMSYLAAAQRHILAYLDGENTAEDSGQSHIAHAIAGLMVLLDAIECNNSIDNRPIKGQSARLLKRFTNDKPPF